MEDIERVERWIDDPDYDFEFMVRRNDLNLASLPEHGTIEIRLMEGTLDPDVTEAWIKFGQRLIHEVVMGVGTLTAAPNGADLLSRIKLSADARRILAAKQAANHLTPRTCYDPSWGDDEY